jgi:hypothetical protein
MECLKLIKSLLDKKSKKITDIESMISRYEAVKEHEKNGIIDGNAGLKAKNRIAKDCLDTIDKLQLFDLSLGKMDK